MIALQGFIADIRHTPQLLSPLTRYDGITEFNINSSKSYGLIQFPESQDTLAFSKWVSPKRTRSYPFARIYNIYGQNSKCVTIIPIIKDEGLAGDNDRINAITFSWMSLMNVYIILAWYDDGVVSRRAGKITKQRFDNDYIRAKIEEIRSYRASALHWNTTHFKRDFVAIYQQAIESYERLGHRIGITMHNSADHVRALARFTPDGVFNIDAFKAASLNASELAARREVKVNHRLEILTQGAKGLFVISNYLGGEYYLTADELFFEDDTLVIQESKNNSRGKLPKLADIQDGLFKLILFTNLERLLIDGQPIQFRVRLKLTGNLKGILILPSEDELLDAFIHANALGISWHALVKRLNAETQYNKGLTVMITGHL